MGVNAAGIRSKMTSFKDTLNKLEPEVFFIEETKMKEEGKLKFENYDVFELTRKSRDGGGGLAIGCKKALQAAWVREGNDKVESLSVDIFVKNMRIRCCVAYGCQESDNIERKESFWNYISEEVSIAENNNSGFVLHFDGNLWAGEKIIPGDPKKQNRNGKLFQKFLEDNPNLTVVNSLPLCQGVITRSRVKNGIKEESVIDFFVVCNKVLPFIKKMVIDEERKFTLTNFEKLKTGGKAINTDHFTQYMDVELEIEKVKPERILVYDIKKKINQEKFQKLTSETSEFTNCFQTNAPLYAQIENWRILLKSYCNLAFPKIRIKKKSKIPVNNEISKLICRRNEIASKLRKNECLECYSTQKSKSNVEKHTQKIHEPEIVQHCRKCSDLFTSITDSRTPIKRKHLEATTFECPLCREFLIGKDRFEIHNIEHTISNIEAQENRFKIVKNFKSYSDNPENINRGEMWRLLKKIWPKYDSKSKAKRNHIGKIVSNPREIKQLMTKEYKERLRQRPLRPDLKILMKKRKNIFEKKFELAQRKKTPEWTMKNLDVALDKLKNKKSRDFEGYSNEIFKNDIIGSDLKMSFLMMFNKIKIESYIPKFMNCANITTVPKSGSQLELRNERGIFRVSVLRSILMNLVYERKYPEIDINMTECQMGGRRKKGSKNNIFLLNGIIHESLKSKQSVVLQYYDYAQMFDSINLKEAVCDIFDAGLDDENLALIYKANKEINMAVKTAHGLSERVEVKDSVLQGDKFGSLMASVQVDKIGKDSIKAGHHFLYKNTLPIGFLGLVDDIVGITEAGHKASELNAFINIKTAEKTLQFGPSKCKYMIVGKNASKERAQNLQVDLWKTNYVVNKINGIHELREVYEGKVDMEKTDTYKYLGFVISSNGNNMANIRQIKNKSIGVIRKILSKLASLNLNQYYFECGLILMNSVLRGTILYASDIYYNLKENEMREIERIEEGFLRKLLKTTKGCPITSLYLEIGQTPARFEIIKMRLLYLKYILEQPEDSNIAQMLRLQLEMPSTGDWCSTVGKDLEYLGINMKFEEIRTVSKQKFREIIKEKIGKVALNYLLDKRGKKGQEITYSCVEMAEYLVPFNNSLTIEEKCEIFAIRNRMINIPFNFSTKCEYKCECGKLEDMQHIYMCELWNKVEQPLLSYEKIFNGNLKQQIAVYKKFKQNMLRRETKTSNPCDSSSPLFSVRENK